VQLDACVCRGEAPVDLAVGSRGLPLGDVCVERVDAADALVPVNGSTAAKMLAVPHRLYSSSTLAGVPGISGTGLRVCSSNCLLVSSRQTCGRSESYERRVFL
jgi:hypothetical protein